MKRKRERKLPTPEQLAGMRRKESKRLTHLFKLPELAGFRRPHLSIGLRRLYTKHKVAALLARFMQKERIGSVGELAKLVYIGSDHIEALDWLRFPAAFSRRGTRGQKDQYLLFLCDLEWNDNQLSWKPYLGRL